MKAENRKVIQEAVAEAGTYLQPRIKPTPQIPNRNAFAHVWKAIKTAMGRSYRECDDCDVPRILEVIAETRSQGDGELNP